MAQYVCIETCVKISNKSDKKMNKLKITQVGQLWKGGSSQRERGERRGGVVGGGVRGLNYWFFNFQQ